MVLEVVIYHSWLCLEHMTLRASGPFYVKDNRVRTASDVCSFYTVSIITTFRGKYKTDFAFLSVVDENLLRLSLVHLGFQGFTGL